MPPYRIQSAQRRVGREPLPGVSQTANATGAFGGQEAAAITQFGRDIQTTAAAVERRTEAEELKEQKITLARDKATLELQDRKDKAFAEEELLSFQEERIRYEAGAFQAQRGDSVGLLDRTSEWLKKARDTSLGRLPTSRSKEYFNKLANPEHTKTLIKSGTREAEQFALWDVELKDALFANATIQAGKPDSTELDLIDLEIQAIDALNAKYKGFDAETKKKAVANGMTAYHTSVINGKLVADLPFAKEYFKENKQLIPPKEREVIRLAIRKEDVSQSSIRIADEIALTVEDNNEWAAQVEKKTKDPEIQKQAKSILDAKKKDEAAHDNELKTREYTTALDKILEAQTLEERRAIADTIEDPENRLKALNTADALSKEEPIKTDNEIYLQLLDDIGAGKYKARSELLEFVPSLSTAHFNNAVNAFETKQREDKTGKKDKDADIKYSTAKDAFSVALGEDYDVGDDDQNRQFIFAYDKLIDSGITDFKEAKDFISNLFIDGEVRGFLWDPDLTRPQAEAQGKLDEWLPNILTVKQDFGVEERAIAKALKSRGIVTDNPIIHRLFKKDAILKLPLSESEKKEYRALVKEAGVMHQMQR